MSVFLYLPPYNNNNNLKGFIEVVYHGLTLLYDIVFGVSLNLADTSIFSFLEVYFVFILPSPSEASSQQSTEALTECMAS